MKLFKLTLAVILFVLTAESLAKFELPPIIDHYMVLQQNTEANLWGWIEPGEDRKFVSAEARIEGSAVVVYADEVKIPAAVRFGWANVSEPNLFNRESLPAGPFRTDNWE